MDVRAQVSMVFHLDKCIGCHTCSVACKNVWTDRPGAEYMWWNNVETKPGTGYPTRWEDQLNYKGGWKVNEKRELVCARRTRASSMHQLFYNPNQPGLDDYYEPWTYKYNDLFDARVAKTSPPQCRSLKSRGSHEHRGRPELGRRPRRLTGLCGE
jgi:nitrate reductase beta subunit